MPCPKCGQVALNLDEERDVTCFMCGYSSARREPTASEIVATKDSRLSVLRYGDTYKHVVKGWEYRIMHEPLSLLDRRREFPTKKKIKNVNKKFNASLA